MMQNSQKKVSVQMKDQQFNGQDLISVINVLAEIKRACDYSRILEVAAVYLF